MTLVGADEPKPPRIKTLEIKDFRAFGGSEPFVFELGGKNLLVYGENGSGKSSIFHALDEMFSVKLTSSPERRDRLAALRNRFSGLGLEDGRVAVTFDDGLAPAIWSAVGHPADVNPTADLRVVNAAWRKAMLDYRALLDTNYRFADGEVNLFDVCVRVLLRDYPIVHEGRSQPLFDVWRRLEVAVRQRPLLAYRRAALNALAASFNEGFREALAQVQPNVGGLLADLGWSDLALAGLSTPGLAFNGASRVRDRAFNGCEVSPELEFCGYRIDKPQSFLNEARLSALALAIYFAGRQICASTLQPDTPRIMVLDDVLIGLDLANRIPVLKVPDQHFSNWQIILLTHDRNWFDLAWKRYDAGHDWISLTLHPPLGGDGRDSPTVRWPKADIVKEALAEAGRHLDRADTAAAANATRRALEWAVRRFCEKQKVRVVYQADPKDNDLENLLNALPLWVAEQANKRASLTPIIADLRMYRTGVLHPQSHAGGANVARQDVEGAMAAVKRLIDFKAAK